MEAARDFIPFEDEGQGTDRCTGPAAGCGANPGRIPGAVHGTVRWTVPARASGVDGALAALQDVSATAVEDAASWGLKAASDFAGQRRGTLPHGGIFAGCRGRPRWTGPGNSPRRTPARPAPSWTTGWRDDAPGSAPAFPADGGTGATGARLADRRGGCFARCPWLRWMTGTGTRRSSCGPGC